MAEDLDFTIKEYKHVQMWQCFDLRPVLFVTEHEPVVYTSSANKCTQVRRN